MITSSMRSQEFGFHMENIVRTVVHKIPAVKNSTSVHDISKEENALDPTESQSVKTTGSRKVDCGKPLSIFNYDFKEKHTMIIFCYKQETPSKRVINRVIELNMNEEFKRVVFGSVTYEELESVDKYLKSIPKNGRTTEVSRAYKMMTKQLKEKTNSWFTYNPRVYKSGVGNRLQCSIPNLDTFIEKNNSLVLSDTTECILRGISIPKEHEGFGKRITHKKEELDLSLSSLQI